MANLKKLVLPNIGNGRSVYAVGTGLGGHGNYKNHQANLIKVVGNIALTQEQVRLLSLAKIH